MSSISSTINNLSKITIDHKQKMIEFIFFVVNLLSNRWFLYALMALLIVVIFFCVYFYVKKKRSDLLTIKVKKQLKQYKNRRLFFANNFFEKLYLPSWQSIFFVIIIVFILYFIARINYNNDSLNFNDNNHYQNLIAIYAGIGAIIFALLIFIAESFREDETKDRARVLMKESFLFPLTVGEILGFFVFSWGNVGYMAVIPLIVISVATVASLYKLFSVLLSKSKFAEKRKILLNDRLEKSIGNAIAERIGTIILLESLGEGKIELQYNPWISISDNESQYNFYADREGIITDVRMDKLSCLAKVIEQNANRKGFSFYKEKVNSQKKKGAFNTNITEQEEIENYINADRHYVCKKFNDAVQKDNKLLFSFDKRIIDEETKGEVAKLVKDVFIIKKKNNFSEELTLELDGLQDQFLAAIAEGRIGKIKELFTVYIGLAESFLSMLKNYDSTYSYQQAKNELSALWGGWGEIKWLSDSVREIYYRAEQSNDIEVIKEVLYLPFVIANKAIEFKDQYVYQHFIWFSWQLYNWSTTADARIKQYLFDRSWRYLKEISDFFIEYKIKEKTINPIEIISIKDFSIPILTTFQSLIKLSLEKKDKEAFDKFLSEFFGLFDGLNFDYGYLNIENLKSSLDIETDLKKKEEIRKKMELQQARFDAHKDILSKRGQITFGLTAWIFNKFYQNPSDQNLAEFYNSIAARLPNDLPGLTSIYLSARNFKIQDYWGWDDWEGIPDGQVHSIDFHSKLDKLYCIKSLHILQNVSEEAMALIKLPIDRDWIFLASEDSGQKNLLSLLSDIEGQSQSWSFILSQQQILKISNLKEIIIHARENQEKEDKKYLETAPINPKKIEEFKEELLKGFKKSTALRRLFEIFGAYNDLTEQISKEKLDSWGFNQVDDKAALIDDWYVHYGNWGERYGKSMAHSEDVIMFGFLLDNAKEKKEITKNKIMEEIESVIVDKKFDDPIIISSMEYLLRWDNVEMDKNFIHRYDKRCSKRFSNINGFVGIFLIEHKMIPVIGLHPEKAEQQNIIIITDLKKFANWEQYSPIDTIEDNQYKFERFYLKIVDLNQDDKERKKILCQNADWLNKQEDKESYLKRHFLINFFQKFKLQVKDDSASVCLIIKNNN